MWVSLCACEMLVTTLMLYTYFYHILFGFLDGILDVKVSLCISDGVTDTNGMTWRKYQNGKYQTWHEIEL